MTTQGSRLALEQMVRLDGQVAIVTGGAKGIGRGIVRRFAEAGASVLIADVAVKEAEAARDEIVKGGGKAAFVQADLTNEDCGDRILAAVLREFGRADVLVNNAGIYPFKPALDMTAAEWDRVQHVNLRATFLISKAFANHAKQRGGGAIVNIGSIDALHPSAVGLAAYDASKGGMLMFTKAFALEVAPLGIRVNMVAPGGIATEGATGGLTGMTPEQQQAMMAQFTALIPMGRMGEPDDIATVTLALVTPLTAYMTGATVVVDGGRLLK